MTSERFDAVIVGSGATGGMAAQVLTEAGLRVLVLEAGAGVTGRDYGPAPKNIARQLYRHFVSKRQRVQEAHATYWTTNPDFFVDDDDNPYTTPPDKPFRWIRGRRLGGRTLTWDGVTPRMSDFELKAASRDGIGVDWPLSHADLAPYYERVEKTLAVYGSREGLAQLPDGAFVGERPLTAGERVFKERVEKRFGDRRVIISRGIRAGRTPPNKHAHSPLSSVATTLDAARRTGRLTVRTNAVVAGIVTQADGARAIGLDVVDAVTGAHDEIRASLVFLCASTIETLRIMMNSKSRAHPAGIGASSGILGKYVMDHVASNVYFTLPVRPNGTHELLGSDAIMIPRWQNLDEHVGDLPRGFGLWGGIERLPIPRPLLKHPREVIGFLCARAETLPDADNRVELDPNVRDRWGIPSARIVCEWKPHDLKVAEHARKATVEMIEAAGGTVANLPDLVHMPIVEPFLREMQKEWECSTPGLFCHEVGGARMGTDAKSSVVDPFGRCWDVPNVFVTDGACWPSCGWQNPTLTMMAVTARACDRAIASLRES